MVYDLSLYDDVFVTDKLKAAMQELDCLFSSEPTELIGDAQYGAFFEQFLWDLQARPSAVKDYITRIIENNTYYVLQYDWDVSVTVNDGSETARNIVGDIVYDNSSIYIVKIDLYASAEPASYARNKLGTKIIQF